MGTQVEIVQTRAITTIDLFEWLDAKPIQMMTQVSSKCSPRSKALYHSGFVSFQQLGDVPPNTKPEPMARHRRNLESWAHHHLEKKNKKVQVTDTQVK